MATQENKLFFPIIVYHKIDYKKELGASVIHPDIFRKQIQRLAQIGYKTQRISDMIENKVLNINSICIFFDDGYENIYQYAYPVLAEHGYCANIAVISDYIGKYNDWDVQIGSKYRHLNYQQIKFLVLKGWELVSHTCFHKKLTKIDNATADIEIKKSKEDLEARFSVPVKHFVYPYGAANDSIAEKVKEYGYTGASGFLFRKRNYPQYQIPRFAIYSFDSFSSILSKIHNSHKEKIKQKLVNFCNNGSSFLTLNK